MWFVYILRCSDDSLYIGETNNVANRLAKHNDGTAATYEHPKTAGGWYGTSHFFSPEPVKHPQNAFSRVTIAAAE